MRKEILILLVIAAIIITAAIVGTYYYQKSVQNEQKAAPSENVHLVRPDNPTLGPAGAKVTVVEFLDPECESCRAFSPAVKQFVTDYPNRVRLVIRYMPFHPNARLAASYIEAAREQGKFWEMLELAFERQPEWGERHGAPSAMPPEQPQILFERYATEIGLDLPAVRAAVASNKFARYIERDFTDGQSLGVTQTPTIFVNGRLLVRFSQPDLKALIEDELGK